MRSDLSLRLALAELRQGWRHFAVFLACLMLGVAVMASVGMLSAAVERALEREKQSLLGGDLDVLAGNQALAPEQEAELARYGKLSHVSTLRSMLRFGDQPSLVEVKAVDGAYPLLGRLQLQETITPAEALAGNGVVVDAVLLSQLGAKVGDEVTLGESRLIIRATLKREPDRAVQLVNFGPRVMMRQETLAATGLVTPLSLIKQRYRILLNEPARREEIAETLRTRHEKDGWGVVTEMDGNSLLRRFFEQLTTFLSLAGLATFLIAGVGIGSSVRAYLQKKTRTIATLKIFGASRARLLGIYLLVLGVLALAGSLAGVCLAALAVSFLLPALGSYLPVAREASLFLPQMAVALWYGLLITYLFSLPALLGMVEVRPALLFRSRSAPLPAHRSLLLVALSIALAGLILLTMLLNLPDPAFLAGAIGLMLAAFLIFALCAALVRALARRLNPATPWLRLAMGNLHRPGAATGTVIFALGISLTLLIALTLTEANFQARVESVAREKAPSLFMIDVQPFEKDAVHDLLAASAGEANVAMQPMLRARVSSLNGRPIREEAVKPDARWIVRSDRGLSYGGKPANAEISQGKWWPEDYRGAPLISVDERFLDGLGARIGDKLGLELQGERIDATIASTRRIDYTTFQINFSMILSPNVLEDYPQTWLATLRQPDEEKQRAVVRQLAKHYPGITIIRTAEAVALVQEVTRTLSAILRVVVMITLLAGLMVLASTLAAAVDQRKQEIAIFKMLGARRADLLRSLSAEWLLLAALTAGISALLGTIGAWLVMARFPGSGFSPMPGVLGLTILATLAVVWLTGYLSNRRLFGIRPARLLRGE